MDCRNTAATEEIYRHIPHRPPFLWVDTILSSGPDSIETEKTFHEELDFFRGHYPDYPLVPGVILCEALFQSGAILISSRLMEEEYEDNFERVPVLTRIYTAKFKREVLPGNIVRMKVNLSETMGNVWFMKGTVFLKDKVAVKVEFACTVTIKKLE